MKKKLLFLMLITAFLLMFAACGGTLDTTVNLNEDFSGTRVMKYTVSKSDFNEYVSGDIASVDATIAANVPANLTYAFSEDESNYIATFTMNFSSLEEQSAQASALINDGGEYSTNFLVGESVFSKGFVYEEDWYSTSVMSWLETLLVNSGYVSSSNQSYIFNDEVSRVSYKGETVDSGNQISVSTMDYIPIENIRIFTDVNSDGTYNRKIELDIIDANLLANEEDIKAFMEESVPAGAEGKWVSELGMNTYTVAIANATAEEVQAAMNTYSHSENAKFVTSELTEEDTMTKVLFAENACFDEHLDMAAYGCNSEGSVRIYYYINKEKVQGQLKYDVEVDETGYETSSTAYPDFDEMNQAYYKYDLRELRETDIEHAGQYFYHFGNIAWDTKVKGAKKITREITLVFDDGTTEEQSKVLEEKIKAFIDASEEKLDVSVSAEKSEELPAMKLIFKGSAMEIAKAYEYLTGFGRSDDIFCVEEERWIGVTKACIFEESVRMAGLVNAAYGDEYWAIPVSYTLDMPGIDPNKKNYDETNYDAKKGLIIAETVANDSINMGAVTNKFAPMGIVWILVLLASIVCFLVGVAGIVIAIIKKVKSKKGNATTETQTPVTEAPKAAPAAEETKVEEVKTEEVPVEEAQIEEAKTEEAPVEETNE